MYAAAAAVSTSCLKVSGIVKCCHLSGAVTYFQFYELILHLGVFFLQKYCNPLRSWI